MTTLPLTRDERPTLPHAWTFAIVATLGFLPGTYGLMMAAVTLVLLIPVLPIWTFGTALMLGYWMHALGHLRGPDARRLWGATALYNTGAALCWGWWAAHQLELQTRYGFEPEQLLVLLPAVVTGALAALALDARRREPVAG